MASPGIDVSARSADVRRLAALLVVVVVGYPLAILPTTVVAVAAGGAVALCALGVVTSSTSVLTAGVALAIAEHALALSLSDGPPRLGGAVVAGVGVALLLEIGDFDRRFRRAALGPRVLASQLWYWAGFAALGAATTLVLLAAASAITATVRVPWAPVLAAAGALTALGAAAVALRQALASGGQAS